MWGFGRLLSDCNNKNMHDLCKVPHLEPRHQESVGRLPAAAPGGERLLRSGPGRAPAVHVEHTLVVQDSRHGHHQARGQGAYGEGAPRAAAIAVAAAHLRPAGL